MHLTISGEFVALSAQSLQRKQANPANMGLAFLESFCFIQSEHTVIAA